MKKAERSAFTLIEVVVAMTLIVAGFVGIYAVQAQSMQMMRQARNFSAASRLLEQREEQLRTTAYSTLATSAGALSLMNGTAGKMTSESELAAVQDLTETLIVSSYARPGVVPVPSNQSFTVIRTRGAASASGTPSLQTLPQVVARLRLTWRDTTGSHRREFSTMISNGGLTLSGRSREP
jgi:prepilin-type N-terminal cleavage/methylation domain-containing protein